MAAKTKLRGNQINIRDVFNHPDALATTDRVGAVEVATQAEVLAGSPIGVVVTTDTLKNHPGLDELKDMYVTSGSPSDTLHSDKLLFNLEVNSSNVFTAEELPDYGFDAASVTYASKTASFSPVSGSVMGSAFIRPDGMAVYIVDSTSDPGTIKEYLLGTAWDISTKVGAVNSSYVMSSGDHANDMRGIWFNADGTKAIVSGSTQWAEYSFSPGYDLTSATFIQAVNDIGESTGASALSFSEDGSYAYRIRRAFSLNNWYIASYSVGTPWDVSTISLISQDDQITAETGSNQPYGVTVNQDGTKIFVVHDNTAETSGTSKIREYSLATPYLVSSRTLAASSVQSQSRYLRYMFWSPFGTDLYMLDNAANIYQYTSSAVDLGGLTTSLLHDGVARIQTKGTGALVNGILEISGTNAQLALPNYATASLPVTTIEGGIVYDSDDGKVKLYSGSPAGWVNLSGGVIVDQYRNVVGVTGAGASITASAVDNIILGLNAGNSLESGKENVFLGLQAGQYSVNGSYAVLIGKQAGKNNGNSFHNIGIGNASLGYNSVGVSGSYNIAIGLNSLDTITSGAYNTVVGHSAGKKITTGTYNLCLGYNAGPATNQSNQLFIDASETDTPLIHANFSTNVVDLHGRIEAHAAKGATGQGEIRIWDDTNTAHTTGNYVAVKAPSPVGSPSAANWTLTLPPNDGTSGQVLQTDGNGVTSWATAAGGATVLNDLTDVVITDGGSPVNVMTDQVLTFSGTNWVNQSPVFRENNANIIGGTGAFPNEGLYGGQSGNIVIGVSAGAGIQDSQENVIIGNVASTVNNQQDFNVSIGARSCRYAWTQNMVAVGAYAGEGVSGDTSANINTQSVFVGSKAARYAYTADQCTIVGRSAGEGTSTSRFTGNNNTFLGFSAGKFTSYGNNNTFIGHNAGLGNGAGTAIQGHNNVAVGVNAFDGVEAVAVGNTVLGSQAGRNLVSGDQNVIIGYGAGPTTDESGKLYISNTSSATDTPLIFGDFTAGEVKINGELQTVAISETADTYGTSGAVALDTSAATYFYPTGATTGVITFSFTNPAGGSPIQRVTSFTLELWGGEGSPSPFVWPSSVKWAGGTEPTWTATAGSPIVNGYDVVSFITRDGGTTWLGMLGGLAFK